MNDIPGPPVGFTVTDTGFIKCPFDHYGWMRDAQPVFKDPVTGFFVVSRYEDVRKIAMAPTDWSSKTSQIINRDSSIAAEIATMFSEHGWLPMDTLVTNDPPDHRRYRALVDRAFTTARVRSIQPLIDATIDRYLPDVVGVGPVNFVQRFAVPLTMTMIANQLGVDSADMARFRRWTDSIMEGINPELAPDRERAITLDVIEMQNYLAEAIERYRQHPGETILSDLVYAEVGGERLTVQEIIAVSTLLLGAGNDTTTAALGSAVRHLAEHPEQFTALAAAPEHVPNFVEEILRLYAPVQRLFRRATADLRVGDTHIPAGSVIMVQWGAANRDPRRFAEADVLDLARPDASKHLTFGAGIHFCIGNQLARAELCSAIAALATRTSGIRPANGEDSFDYYPQIINLSPSCVEVIIDR